MLLEALRVRRVIWLGVTLWWRWIGLLLSRRRCRCRRDNSVAESGAEDDIILNMVVLFTVLILTAVHNPSPTTQGISVLLSLVKNMMLLLLVLYNITSGVFQLVITLLMQNLSTSFLAVLFAPKSWVRRNVICVDVLASTCLQGELTQRSNRVRGRNALISSKSVLYSKAFLLAGIFEPMMGARIVWLKNSNQMNAEARRTRLLQYQWSLFQCMVIALLQKYSCKHGFT